MKCGCFGSRQPGQKGGKLPLMCCTVPTTDGVGCTCRFMQMRERERCLHLFPTLLMCRAVKDFAQLMTSAQEFTCFGVLGFLEFAQLISRISRICATDDLFCAELLFSSPSSNGKLETENMQQCIGKASKDEDDLGAACSNLEWSLFKLDNLCCWSARHANCKARGGWERVREITAAVLESCLADGSCRPAARLSTLWPCVQPAPDALLSGSAQAFSR